jgi:hypothetical protein
MTNMYLSAASIHLQNMLIRKVVFFLWGKSVSISNLKIAKIIMRYCFMCSCWDSAVGRVVMAIASCSVDFYQELRLLLTLHWIGIASVVITDYILLFHLFILDSLTMIRTRNVLSILWTSRRYTSQWVGYWYLFHTFLFSQAEVTQRLNNAREAANRSIVHSHEDLAIKTSG